MGCGVGGVVMKCGDGMWSWEGGVGRVELE